MKYLIYIFYFFCLFPYVQILPFNTDSQPNALIVAIILLNPSVCMQIACVRKKKSSYILLQLLDF